MKTTKLFLIPAILAALTFASCSDYDNGFTVNQIKYDKAFIDAFGYIDPNQDWNLVKQLEEKNGGGTRTAEPGWENLGYTKPNSITQEEIDKVLAVFNQKGEEYYEPLVDWSEFFVQHVWKGTASYTAGNGGTVVGGDHMDGLRACTPDGYDDPVNNFNNAFGSIMLMINSSTQRFGYNSSEDGQIHYYFRMEYIDGAYYVGLDFSAEGEGSNQQVQRDYIYNDWIIKIVPAHGETPEPPKDQPAPEPKEEIIEAGLLCCEDLGGEEADFDFNDIVLKLEQKRRTSVESGKEVVKDYFVITAMAAGGTLPSYVFYKSLKNADEIQDRFYYSDWTPFGEVNGKNGIHGMMGGGDLEPINVGNKFEGEGESHEYEVTDAIDILRAYTNENAEVQEKIRLYADHYVSYVFDRARIRIYVNAESPTDTLGRPYIEPIYHGIEDDEETSSFRAANTPQMMLLPLRFEWPTEATFIGTAYPDFGNWVREKESMDWYLKSAGEFYVTTRKVDGEELQPFLRWKDNDDIYLSITIKEGETIDLFCTSLNHNNPSVSDNSSSDIASAGNIYYVANGLDNHEFGLKLTGLKAGNTTITLTQDANEKYRAESITLNVTVEGNGTVKPEPDPQPGEDGYTEVQVSVEPNEGWGHTIVKTESKIGNDYPYGAWVEIVFSAPHSNVTLSCNNKTYSINGQVYILELMASDMPNLMYNVLELNFDVIDRDIKIYIKPKTIEDAYGFVVGAMTTDGKGYEIPADAFKDCTTSATITFVYKGDGANFRYQIGNNSPIDDQKWNGTFEYVLTGNDLIEVKKNGFRLLEKEYNNFFSSIEARMKESSSSVKRRRTVRR